MNNDATLLSEKFLLPLGGMTRRYRIMFTDAGHVTLDGSAKRIEHPGTSKDDLSWSALDVDVDGYAIIGGTIEKFSSESMVIKVEYKRNDKSPGKGANNNPGQQDSLRRHVRPPVFP